MINNSERPSFQPENFQASLDSILSRQLIPETINTYASDALNELVELAERTTKEYNRQPTLTATNVTEAEDHAFSYFNLGQLESSLDHVADLAESIHSIDEIIKNTIISNRVIVPPDNTEQIIQPGNGGFSEKILHNRLKTILFILQQDFSVDIHNKRQLTLVSGDTDGIMRKSSYYLVEIPELNRSILVCDEEGNATYVFDNEVLSSNSMTEEAISRMSKDELSNLIKTIPGIGKRFNYSTHFIENIKDSIEYEIPYIHSVKEVSTTTDYLKKIDKAPDGYLSLYRFAIDLKISDGLVYKIAREHTDSIGEPLKAKFASRVADAYSPTQQELILYYLEADGALTELAPDGFLSIGGIAKEFKTTHAVVVDAIEDLKDQIGDPITAKFAGVVTSAYSPPQQELIRVYLDSKGLFLKPAPQGYLSLNGFANNIGVAYITMVNAAGLLEDELGEVTQAKFGGKAAGAYSPKQQSIIKEYLDSKGNLSEAPPEGYLSAKKLAEKFDVAPATLSNAIESLRGQIGETITSRFGFRTADAYSPAQQETVRMYLERRGNLLRRAPDGYLSFNGILENSSYGSHKLNRAITDQGDKLGEIIKARFGGQVSAAYSPSQQEIINAYIVEKYNDLGS